MLKVALIAAALAAAPAAHAVNADPATLAASAPELAAIGSAPAASADWAPVPPSRGVGLDFKDAATEPAGTPPPDDSGNARNRVVPALFALGALVVLLRKRPT
jgi:hypothetical protein